MIIITENHIVNIMPHWYHSFEYIGRILPAFAITTILAQLPSLALGASFQDLSTQTAIRGLIAGFTPLSTQCNIGHLTYCPIVHVEQMVEALAHEPLLPYIGSVII